MEAQMKSFGSALPGYSNCPTHHLVITNEEEYDFGWVYYYDTEEYVETGFYSQTLAGNAPLIVDRVDGRIYVTGSAYPLSHYIGEYRKGIRIRIEDATSPIEINPIKLRSTISALSELLAQQDYESFCGFARNSRLTPGGVSRVIRKYRRHLIPLPDVAYKKMEVVPISESIPQRWTVIVPLWTKEEGRSDLSLDITLQNSIGKTYTVDINDLHVL